MKAYKLSITIKNQLSEITEKLRTKVDVCPLIKRREDLLKRMDIVLRHMYAHN